MVSRINWWLQICLLLSINLLQINFLFFAHVVVGFGGVF